MHGVHRVDRPDKGNKAISEFERVQVFSVFLIDSQDVYVVEFHCVVYIMKRREIC